MVTIQPLRPVSSETPNAPARPPARRRAPWLFAAVVVLPTALTAFYFLVLAAPQYVSEAKFIVRAPSEPPALGVSAVLQSVGISRSETDAYAVHEYIMSRQALAQVDRTHHLRALLGQPRSDLWARFPRPFEAAKSENLYRAYKRFVSVGYDSTTGISTLEVRAFRPGDAQAIAQALLDGGETVINSLNTQAEEDAVGQATQRVAVSRGRVAAAQAALTGFRNREQVVDPEGASKSGLELINRLSNELAVLQAERAGLAANAPQSPQLPPMDNRIRAYQRQIEAERETMTGHSNSLAPKIADYERLVLDRDIAGRQLSGAMVALETATLDASRKRLYLQRVVDPGLTDEAEYPHRWRNLLTVFLASLLAYGAVSLVWAGLREHRQ